MPMGEGVAAGFIDSLPTIDRAMREIWKLLESVTITWPQGFVKIGHSIIAGLVRGIRERATEFKDALLSVLPPAIRGVLAQMGIASPSRVAIGISDNIMDGFIQPFKRRADEVKDAMSGLIQPMTQSPGMPALAGGAGAMIGGGKTEINIHMGGVTMANEMDAYSVAYRMAKRVKDGI
jgi:hypothetical protein